MGDRNPYRRFEETVKTIIVVMLCIVMVVMLSALAWFIEEFRYVLGGVLAIILYWVIADSIKEKWNEKKQAWDDANRRTDRET